MEGREGVCLSRSFSTAHKVESDVGAVVRLLEKLDLKDLDSLIS